MKMRKLFAGIAAAATLLGGMALGATSAQAGDAATTAGSGTIVNNDAKFKFTAQDAKQLTNRKLNAYKIADYVQYGTGGDDAAYGVQTASTVTDNSGIKAALKAAVVGTNKTVPTDGSDPDGLGARRRRAGYDGIEQGYGDWRMEERCFP